MPRPKTDARGARGMTRRFTAAGSRTQTRRGAPTSGRTPGSATASERYNRKGVSRPRSRLTGGGSCSARSRSMARHASTGQTDAASSAPCRLRNGLARIAAIRSRDSGMRGGCRCVEARRAVVPPRLAAHRQLVPTINDVRLSRVVQGAEDVGDTNGSVTPIAEWTAEPILRRRTPTTAPLHGFASDNSHDSVGTHAA